MELLEQGLRWGFLKCSVTPLTAPGQWPAQSARDYHPTGDSGSSIQTFVWIGQQEDKGITCGRKHQETPPRSTNQPINQETCGRKHQWRSQTKGTPARNLKETEPNWEKTLKNHQNQTKRNLEGSPDLRDHRWYRFRARSNPREILEESNGHNLLEQSNRDGGCTATEKADGTHCPYLDKQEKSMQLLFVQTMS